MLDTPCSEVVWRVLATHRIRQFPLHFPSRASPCAITFQPDSKYICLFTVSFLSWFWYHTKYTFCAKCHLRYDCITLLHQNIVYFNKLTSVSSVIIYWTNELIFSRMTFFKKKNLWFGVDGSFLCYYYYYYFLLKKVCFFKKKKKKKRAFVKI